MIISLSASQKLFESLHGIVTGTVALGNSTEVNQFLLSIQFFLLQHTCQGMRPFDIALNLL